MSLPTIASLCRALGGDLQPAPGFDAPDREICAVHISELPDPVGYLSGGELLLSTGLTLPTSRRGCDLYVSRLVDVGVSALAFGLGPVHGELPEELMAACADQHLPLLVVPAPTPFQRITAAFWKAVSRSAAQHLRDVLAAQRALVSAAASSDAESAVLRTISSTLDGWAATFRAGGELGEVVPQRFAGQAEVVRSELRRLHGAGVHSAASLSTGSSTVVVYPLAVSDRVVGFLAVGTARPLDPARRRLVLTAVALLSLEIVRLSRVNRGPNEAQRCVGLLVERGLVEAARELAEAVGLRVPGTRLRVLAVGGDDPDAMVETVQRWCPEVIAVPAGEDLAWFLVPLDHPPAPALSHDLSAAVPGSVAALSEPTAVAAVGAVRTRTVAALARLSPGSSLLEISDARGPDRALVERLGEGLDQLEEPLVVSLGGYLGQRGNWEAAARQLGIHRNTLRHRIRRCQSMLAVDLNDPDVSAELWLLMRRRALV